MKKRRKTVSRSYSLAEERFVDFLSIIVALMQLTHTLNCVVCVQHPGVS